MKYNIQNKHLQIDELNKKKTRNFSEVRNQISFEKIRMRDQVMFILKSFYNTKKK